MNLGNNDIGFLTLQNNRAKDINTEFAAINGSFSPTEKIDFSSFIIITNSEIEILDDFYDF